MNDQSLPTPGDVAPGTKVEVITEVDAPWPSSIALICTLRKFLIPFMKLKT
jgi:hypothetical protein